MLVWDFGSKFPEEERISTFLVVNIPNILAITTKESVVLKQKNNMKDTQD
ncbi:MAG: hypothetical protein LBD75_05910 [Candidatus Peribacteria bacterium]|nr:hypothetical protein [Candidatus Peribacteria bacterium]